MEQPEYIRLSEILVAPKTAAARQHLARRRLLLRLPPPQTPPRRRALRPPMTQLKRPQMPPLSAPPRPRPTICSNRFTTAPASKTSPRSILTAPLPPTAAPRHVQARQACKRTRRQNICHEGRRSHRRDPAPSRDT